ncbi:hypothetical protein TCON_2132 [Astathelohania contejeani]|uniref:Uncharacterized protein n=1 Tax=Astathelohania contejeani TaxID=164912 RepID=A0ABQ7HWY6_9MICR|nr:hypothetical protein TCON_2132 [Thelohania contejeani]
MEGKEGINLYEEIIKIDTKVRILGAPGCNNDAIYPEVDIIDANEPETFTLEEFKKIIRDTRLEDKDFILARVTTPDPNDSSTLYNYYYIASEINKVLFKYESDRRLLHRMKARNPLNNLYIMGQVFYYKISADDVDTAIVNYYFGNPKSTHERGRRAFSAIFKHKEYTNSAESSPKQGFSKDTSDIRNTSLKSNSLLDKHPREIINEVKSGYIKNPIIENNTKPMVYDARYFACDDDFLVNPEVRDYFRKNCMMPEDDFLFELDRTQSDIFALLENTEDSDNATMVGWKRVLTIHISLLMTMLGIVVLLGANPIILIIAFPLALITLVSFLCSLAYIMYIRRSTFDSLAVQSIEDV